MQARTEELLYLLLWTAESFARPTWYNMTESFEHWAGRNRLGRRLAELERQKLLERRAEPDLGRVVRLTEDGVRVALGGRNPTARWSRAWDGKWRMVMFDLPVAQRNLRQQLWRTLRRNHLGYLQDSVWITPDDASTLRSVLSGNEVQPDAFLVMEGRPAAGESDEEVVAAAWNFAAINRGYDVYLRLARGSRPRQPELREWLRREHDLWKAAVQRDPLLPSALLPKDYRGRQALAIRRELQASLRLPGPARY